MHNSTITSNKWSSKFSLQFDGQNFVGHFHTLNFFQPNKFTINEEFRGLAKIKLNQKIEGCNDLSMAGELGVAKAYEKIQEMCNK